MNTSTAATALQALRKREHKVCALDGCRHRHIEGGNEGEFNGLPVAQYCCEAHRHAAWYRRSVSLEPGRKVDGAKSAGVA